MKILEGSKIFLLMYYDPEEDPCICDAYACYETALAECRRRNKQYTDPECLTELGDFNHLQYDSADFCYYEVIERTIIM